MAWVSVMGSQPPGYDGFCDQCSDSMSDPRL